MRDIHITNYLIIKRYITICYSIGMQEEERLEMAYKIYKGVHEQRRGEETDDKAMRIPEGFTRGTLLRINELIQEYIEVTGNDAGVLIKQLASKKACAIGQEYITKLEQLVSRQQLIENKDLFMTDASKEMDGSFYTPVIWAEESLKLVAETYDLSEYTVWDPAAGVGNLVMPYIGKCKRVFASSLEQGDVDIMRERLQGVDVFQLDFLSTLDIAEVLPQGLADVIKNNEPLLILTNPPYSKVGATNTWLYTYLTSIGDKQFKNDLLKQFIWQLCNMFDKYRLSNARMVLIGTTSLFLRNTWHNTLTRIYEHFEVERGYFFKASEFKGIFEGIAWGVFTLLLEPVDMLKIITEVTPITLEIRERDPATDEIKVIGAQELRSQSTTKRVTAKQYFKQHTHRKVKLPMFSAYGKLRRDANGNLKLQNGDHNAICYYLTSAHISMMAMYNGLSPLPLTSVAYPITRERYADTVSAFIFSAYMYNTLDYYDRIKLWHIPEDGEEYRVWKQHAIIGAIGHPKFFSYTLREIDLGTTTFTKLNDFFPYTREEAEGIITCPVKLADLRKNPPTTTQEWYIKTLREQLTTSVDARVKAVYDEVMALHRKILEQPYDSENEYSGYYDLGLTQAIAEGILTAEDKARLTELRIKSSEWFRENCHTHYKY